jgi:hypothetical protein
MSQIRPPVVLLELVAPGRFQGGMFFPCAKGLLQSCGIAVRWLRLAVPANLRLQAQDEPEGFPEGLVEKVTAVLVEAQPSHVILSHVAGCALAAFMRAHLAQTRFGLLDMSMAMAPAAGRIPLPGGVQRLDSCARSVLAWVLGETTPAPASGEVNDELTTYPEPDFGFELMQPFGVGLAPFVYLVAGRVCLYRRPLSTSRFFDAPDAVARSQYWGCSFCPLGSPGAAGTAAGTRAESYRQLRRQLEALARTHPRCDEPLCVILIAADVLADPRDLTSLVDGAGLPPCRFLLSYRSDEIVRCAQGLEEAAMRIAACGHRLDLNLVGVESFSARQLDRYHKGYSPEVNLAAIRGLRDLEAKMPQAFGFREYGGCSTILYDPWATPADVALNLAVVRHFGLEGLCGKLLTSRLRLSEGLPLTVAAEREGLLIDRYSDPLLDTARRNFYRDEIPWTFADPRMESLNRLTTRLSEAPEVEPDHLRESLLAWRRETGGDSLGLAQALTAAAAASDTALAPEVLLDRTRQMLDASHCTVRVEPHEGGDPVDWWLESSWECAAFRTGMKPVVKIEDGFPPEAQDRIVATLSRLSPGLTVRARWRRWGGGPIREVFVGRDALAVDEALALTEQLDGDLVDEQAVRRAVERTGILLGYPECCAHAFAESGATFRRDNGWLLLKRRLIATGPAAPEFNPMLTGHVPCSLECERTRDLTARVNARRETEGWGCRGGWPTLVFLDQTADMAMFDPSGPIEQPPEGRVAASTVRLRYRRVVKGRMGGDRWQALQRGNALDIEPGLIRVLRGEREIHGFALEAFVWSHEQVFHGDFWSECVRALQKRDQRQSDAPGSHLPPSSGAAEAQLQALRAAIESTLSRTASVRRPLLRGFSVDGVEERPAPEGWGEIEIRLRRGGERLTIRLGAPKASEPAFAVSTHFAVRHNQDTPADTAEKQDLLRLMLRMCERVAEQLALPGVVPAEGRCGP